MFAHFAPAIAPGVLVHFHDIFAPLDYPEKFVKKNLCFWAEQYLLEAFLSFNYAFKVMWSASAMQRFHPDVLRRAFPGGKAAFVVCPGLKVSHPAGWKQRVAMQLLDRTHGAGRLNRGLENRLVILSAAKDLRLFIVVANELVRRFAGLLICFLLPTPYWLFPGSSGSRPPQHVLHRRLQLRRCTSSTTPASPMPTGSTKRLTPPTFFCRRL